MKTIDDKYLLITANEKSYTYMYHLGEAILSGVRQKTDCKDCRHYFEGIGYIDVDFIGNMTIKDN